jgi:hypothetical protein
MHDAVEHRKEPAQQSFCPHHCHLSKVTSMQLHNVHLLMPAELHNRESKQELPRK